MPVPVAVKHEPADGKKNIPLLFCLGEPKQREHDWEKDKQENVRIEDHYLRASPILFSIRTALDSSMCPQS